MNLSLHHPITGRFYPIPPELAKVYNILQDESLEAPFVEKFNKVIGRASIPVRVFIRMMYLKHTNG